MREQASRPSRPTAFFARSSTRSTTGRARSRGGNACSTGSGFHPGYALWAAVTRSLIWPLMWPHGIVLMATIWLIWVAGGLLLNGMLTSELVLKTRSNRICPRHGEFRTRCIRTRPSSLTGYDIETQLHTISRLSAATTSTSSNCRTAGHSSPWRTSPARACRRRFSPPMSRRSSATSPRTTRIR